MQELAGHSLPGARTHMHVGACQGAGESTLAAPLKFVGQIQGHTTAQKVLILRIENR